MHADQAVLAAVNALAQSPLRPGVLDDVTDVAQLRKQVRTRPPSFSRACKSSFSILAAGPPPSSRARDRSQDPRPYPSRARVHPDPARPPREFHPTRDRPLVTRGA